MTPVPLASVPVRQLNLHAGSVCRLGGDGKSAKMLRHWTCQMKWGKTLPPAQGQCPSHQHLILHPSSPIIQGACKYKKKKIVGHEFLKNMIVNTKERKITRKKERKEKDNYILTAKRMLMEPTGCCAASDSSLSTFCHLNCMHQGYEAGQDLLSVKLSLNDQSLV